MATPRPPATTTCSAISRFAREAGLGSATLSNCTIDHNQAIGGQLFGGNGAEGLGGGVANVLGSTLTVTGSTVTQNQAQGGEGEGGSDGLGVGGGLYLGSGPVYLDAFTLAHVKKNHASTSDPDIYGSYTPLL